MQVEPTLPLHWTLEGLLSATEAALQALTSGSDGFNQDLILETQAASRPLDTTHTALKKVLNSPHIT